MKQIKDESSDKTNTLISEAAPSDETESTKQEKISDTEFNEELENTSQTEENGLTNDNPSEVKKEENEQTNKIEETPVDNNKPDVQNLTTDTPLDETKSTETIKRVKFADEIGESPRSPHQLSRLVINKKRKYSKVQYSVYRET